MLRRDSLRAERDFYAPMTGGTQIRYADAQTPVSGKYGSEVKKRLANIGTGSKRTAQLIDTKKAEMFKTDDPSRSAEAAFYAPMTQNDDRLNNIVGAVSDAADQYTEDRKTTSDQIKEISQAFDKQYGVLQGDLTAVKDQVSTVGTQVSQVKEEIKKKKNTPKKAVKVATKAKEEKPSLTTKRRGGRGGNSLQARAKRKARQDKAKSLARKRLARKKRSSTAGRGFGKSTGINRSQSRRRSSGVGSRSRGATGSKSRRSSTSSRRSTNTSRSRRSGRSTSRSRGGSFGGSRRRGGRGGRRGGRGRGRCDLRCKVDISLLTSMNLVRDDLAEVAYFVKELQEIK